MNNSSLLTADRMTHLKIVVLALVCATLVAGVGVAARVGHGIATHEATVTKPSPPVTASAPAHHAIR